MSRIRAIIFVKPPQVGQSVLGRRIGASDAALVYHRLLTRTLRHLKHAGLQVSVAVSPDAPEFVRLAAGEGVHSIVRLRGKLGSRLEYVMRHAKNGALLIDSDTPSLDAILVRHAAQALGFYDLVVGPNWSGGAYLIGLRTPNHAFRLFENIRWGGRHMLHDLMARVPYHWVVGLLPVLADAADKAGLREAAQDHAPPFRRSSSLGLITMRKRGRSFEAS